MKNVLGSLRSQLPVLSDSEKDMKKELQTINDQLRHLDNRITQVSCTGRHTFYFLLLHPCTRTVTLIAVKAPKFSLSTSEVEWSVTKTKDLSKHAEYKGLEKCPSVFGYFRCCPERSTSWVVFLHK